MVSKKKLSDLVEKEEVGKDSPFEIQGFELPVEEDKGKVRQKTYVMDLRVHSPASLGYLGIGGIDTAPALIRLARVKGIDVIAVTDFYSGHYIDRILAAAKETTVTVIPGVVIRCRVKDCDDVTLSCLFPPTFTSEKIQEFLLALEIPTSSFGDKDHLLELSFEKILETIDLYGGIAMPSRMDKTPHRMKAIPVLVDTYGFRTFDLAYQDSVKFFKKSWPRGKFHLFSFSSAYALAQVGSRIARIKLPELSFSALRQLMVRDGQTFVEQAKIEAPGIGNTL